MCHHGQVYAHNWRLIPSIQLQEVYSDNIKLAPAGQEKSAMVTVLSPGASIIWQAGKSNLNLRYNMQNMYNAYGDGKYSLAHQLQFNAHNVLSKRFYVNTMASVGQQNISNTRLTNSNISGNSGGTTTVSTIGISPTWQPHFGQYADGIVRVNANALTSGAHKASGVNNNSFSDSVSIAETIQLNSGKEFKRVSWSAGFNNYQTYRAGGNDVSFQNSSATLRTYLDKHFSVFATVGHSANSFSTQIYSNQNGFFYTFGGRWSPSRHYWLEVGGGNNSYATLSISPTQRFSWLTTVRHNNIGLNSGTTWQTALNYRTRRSNWSLNHSNDTITVQQLLTESNNPLINGDNPEQDWWFDLPVNRPSLSDEVLVRESWNINASFYTGKSSIRFNAFNQDRTYQKQTVQRPTEHIRGLGALWNWQFAAKTSAYVRPQWQQIDRGGNQKQDNRYDIAVGLNQTITKQLNARLEFRHITQSSDLPTNDYQENSATANLFMRF